MSFGCVNFLMREQEEKILNSATKGKNFAIIGALCLLAYLAGSVYLITKATNSTVYYEGIGNLNVSITVETIIGWITIFLIPATLFTRNLKAVLCAASIYCLYRLYNMIASFSASGFLFFLAAAAFVVAIILTMKKSGLISFFWFLPAAILLVRMVIMYVNTFSNGVTANLAGSFWFTVIFDVAQVAGYLLAGLWLKAAAKE